MHSKKHDNSEEKHNHLITVVIVYYYIFLHSLNLSRAREKTIMSKEALSQSDTEKINLPHVQNT